MVAIPDLTAASSNVRTSRPPRATSNGEIAGLHRTASVDVGTVISGELTLLLPTGETTLRPGDTFVLRGNEHAWRNRTPQPVTIVVTMIGAR